MKIALDTKAFTAIKDIRERLCQLNPIVEKSWSAIGSAFMAKYHPLVDDRALAELLDQLISPEKRRKMLAKRILELTEKTDSASIDALENSIKKLRSSIRKNSEISGKNVQKTADSN